MTARDFQSSGFAFVTERLGTISCTRVHSTGQRVSRTPSRIARSKEDFLLFALGLQGIGGVVQGGREAVIHPGEFAFYDTTRPYELQFSEEFTQLIFQIPRELMLTRVGASHKLTASTFSQHHPRQRIAFDFVSAVANAAETLASETADQLCEQALGLLAVTLDDHLRKKGQIASAHRSAILFRLKAFICAIQVFRSSRQRLHWAFQRAT